MLILWIYNILSDDASTGGINVAPVQFVTESEQGKQLSIMMLVKVRCLDKKGELERDQNSGIESNCSSNPTK